MGKIDGYDEYGRPYEEDEEIPEEWDYFFQSNNDLINYTERENNGNNTI